MYQTICFYRLSSATHNKLLNYKILVNNIDFNDLEFSGTGSRKCKFEEKSFYNRDYDHIATGDLCSIEIKRLGKLISQGTNFTINWNSSEHVNKGTRRLYQKSIIL